MRKITCLFTCCILIAGCSKFKQTWEDNPDNFIEETIEEILEETFDIDVDFSPEDEYDE